MNKIDKPKDEETENNAIAARKKELFGPFIRLHQKIIETEKIESSVSFPVEYDIKFLFQPKA